MADFSIRRATPADIPFLIETIVQAEKSSTPYMGLATLFGLSEAEVRERLNLILEEEEPGCEFSVDSFAVADVDGTAKAALAGWYEDEEQPSSLLKANLLAYHYPQASFEVFRTKAPVLEGITIPRPAGTYQLEYMYADESLRGKGVMAALTAFHEAAAKAHSPAAEIMQIQVFGHNDTARRTNERNGFQQVRQFRSVHPHILTLLPHDTKNLFEKSLK